MFWIREINSNALEMASTNSHNDPARGLFVNYRVYFGPPSSVMIMHNTHHYLHHASNKYGILIHLIDGFPLPRI